MPESELSDQIEPMFVSFTHGIFISVTVLLCNVSCSFFERK